MRADTIPARLLDQAHLRPSAPAYHVKVGDVWRATDWATFVQEVRRVARALMALGLEPGGKVALLGFNRPEWVIFNLGAMCAGGVGAGVYTTSSADEIQYIVHHSEALVLLLEDGSQWAKVAARRDDMPLLRHVVMMKGAPRVDAPGVLSWEELEARADSVSEQKLDERVAALESEGLAALIYTSGTTGPPKGVMLSHGNLAWTAGAALSLLGAASDDTLLSYLPLSHIAEQMLSIHLPITVGGSVYFAESLERVADNLREVQPTVFFGVPRIWEKLYAGVSTRLAAATGAQRAIVDWVRRVGASVSALRNQGRALPLRLRLEHRIAEYLLLGKLRRALGLSRARLCVSGAAPIAREILDYFASLGIIVHEVYGQSEGCGPTSFNFPGRTRPGTVGTALDGVEVKLAEDGEVLVRGPNVFAGYYKDEAATREALVDGWLRSGDLGRMDADGFLTITGRKKEIIITAGGKNIAPSNIELALKKNLLIGEVVVVGDQRKYPTALIALDPEAASRWLAERGLEPAPHDRSPELRAEVQRLVDEVNGQLARVEAIKKFTILPGSFTIGGELTPTLKVKRAVVCTKYAAEIEAMYSEST